MKVLVSSNHRFTKSGSANNQDQNALHLAAMKGHAVVVTDTLGIPVRARTLLSWLNVRRSILNGSLWLDMRQEILVLTQSEFYSL